MTKKKYRPSVGYVINMLRACKDFRHLTRHAWNAETLYSQIRCTSLLIWFWGQLRYYRLISRKRFEEIEDFYYDDADDAFTNSRGLIGTARRLREQHIRVPSYSRHCLKAQVFRERFPFPHKLYNRLVNRLMKKGPIVYDCAE